MCCWLSSQHIRNLGSRAFAFFLEFLLGRRRRRFLLLQRKLACQCFLHPGKHCMNLKCWLFSSTGVHANSCTEIVVHFPIAVCLTDFHALTLQQKRAHYVDHDRMVDDTVWFSSESGGGPSRGPPMHHSHHGSSMPPREFGSPGPYDDSYMQWVYKGPDQHGFHVEHCMCEHQHELITVQNLPMCNK